MSEQLEPSEPVSNDPVVNDDSSNDQPVDESQNESEPKDDVQPEMSKAELDEAKQEVKNQIKKLNIKVDGKTLEREIDLANESELIKIVQMAEMANKRAKEASDLRKNEVKREQELNHFLNSIKSNPEQILSQLGINPTEFAQSVLEKEIKKMELTDEERKILELEEELNLIKEKEAKEKEERVKMEQESLKNKYAADYERDILNAIEKNKLPKSPYMIEKMGNMMLVALDNNIDLSFDDLVPLIKEQQTMEFKEQIQGMSTDDLLSMLSEQSVKEILLKKMPKEEKKKAPPSPDSIKDTGSKKKEDTGIIMRDQSASDFFRNLSKKYS